MNLGLQTAKRIRPGMRILPAPAISGSDHRRSSMEYFDLSLLEATLTRMLISVDCKELTGKLSLLDTTLTKKPGGGCNILTSQNSFSQLVFPRFGCSSVRCLRSTSFLFIQFRTLLQLCKTQPFSYQAIPNSFAKNTRVGGTPTFKPSNLETFQRFPPVPLQAAVFGATIRKGTKLATSPGKQIPLGRCLRIVSGHSIWCPQSGQRGQLELRPFCKSCLGPAVYGFQGLYLQTLS
jgi:hypothetical protein